jgi:putative phage-type endonuclease
MHPSDRLQWLRDRQKGVGGTDVASIAGVGFRTAAEVYADKIAPEPEDRPPGPLLAMGLATEPHNAALYAARTGRRLFSPGLLRSTVHPFAFATFDRLSADKLDSGEPDYGCPVELKYTPFFGDRWGDDGTDHVPDGYLVQATWQLVVLRDRGHAVGHCDVSALSGNGEHRVYRVPFDSHLAGLLLEVAGRFWRHVELREMPGEDWQGSFAGAVAGRLAAIRPDTSVVLPDEALDLADSYRDARAAERAAKDAAEFHKARLVALLGGAETGTLPDGRRVRQRVVSRKSYTVEESSYVDFRITNPRKESRE